jgi:cell wall-associated NlpC family hydrolase
MVQRDLTVNIDGDPSGFDRASDDVVVRSLAMERQIAKLERQMATYEAQVKKTSATQERQAATADRATKQMQGGFVSLVSAGLAAGSAVAGAGAAFVLFSAVAAPSILKVVKAQTDLVNQYAGLDARQKTSSILVQGLVTDYQNLAKAYEPQALAAFNSVVLTAKGLMPQLSSVVAKSTFGIQDFTGQINHFLQGRDAAQFIAWAGDTAPQALHTLGTTATQTTTLATTLVQQVAPLGLTFLQAANGGLSLVNALAKSNPELAQLAITGLAIRAPITGAVASLGNLGEKLSKAGNSAGFLSKAGRSLNAVTGAGPALYVAAGTALAFFALKAFSAKTSTDKLIDSLVISTHAVGNNVAGYRELAQELTQQLNKSLAETNAAQVQVGGSSGKLAGANAAAGREAVIHAQQQQVLRSKLSDTTVAIKNITNGAQQLGQRMGVTSSQAIELADAAGVNLATSVDKSGKLTNEAAAKIEQYSAAVRLAKNPTESLKLDFDAAGNSALLMKDRVTALQAALDAYFTPSIAAYKATIQLKDGFASLGPLLKAARGDMSGNTAASRQLQSAFADQLNTVATLYTATFNQTKSVEAASGAVKRQLPLLYALAGNNKSAREQVDALARSTHNVVGATNISHDAFLAQARAMGIATGRAQDLWNKLQQIHSRTANITIDATGNWNAKAGQNLPNATFHAEGGAVPALWSGASRAYDSQPAVLRVDEHVWTPEEVDAVGGHGAMYRMRRMAKAGKLKGYASGGRVDFTHDTRSDAAVVDQVTHPIQAGMASLMNAVANAMAKAWKEFAGSGGPVVAAARSQIGLPYSWGGGGTGGPSYGIGRGAGTYGFDCSGLTEYAWFKGKGIDIGGSTGPQAAGSTPISGPRPGALGFVGNPIHHVMLGSNRPGYVIQAPHTGAFVEEVQRTSSNWHWPKFASGGQVTSLGDDFTRGRVSVSQAALAKLLQIAGGAPRRESHVAQIADASQIRLWAEPETGGEAYIPLSPSKRPQSTRILSTVARAFGLNVTRLANGGIVSYASGGSDTLDLSGILSSYTTSLNPASKADVTSATKAHTAAVRKLKDAEDALARARRAHHKDWAKIREDERHVKQDREDLAAATRKLADTEQRFRAGQASPATNLGNALGMNIRDTGAFIRNLTTLNARGYGILAQQLLAMGGADAEKIAADAVKFSNSKLGNLQKQITTAQNQASQLANLGSTFTVSNALKTGKYTTFAALQTATGLDATTLATVLRGMQADLAKTAAGKALLADMKTYGFAGGGMVFGPGGVDKVPIWATAGEWVTPAKNVPANLPVLRAIQAGARLGDVYLTGGRQAAAAPTTVHKTNNILPGATVQLAEKVDVAVLAQQLDWQARTASFGGN